MAAQVHVVNEFVRRKRVLEDDVFSCAKDVLKNRSRQIVGIDAGSPKIDSHSFITTCGFGLDPVAVSVRKDQEASPSPGVLQTQPHHHRDQFLQICLTLHRLR